MVRELAVTIYLFVFKVLFTLFNRYPQKKRATFVASFGDNILYTVNELEKQTDEEVVILITAQCPVDFTDGSKRIIVNFEPLHFIDWIRSIYYLATSTHIFVDNYYGFLAVTAFRENVRCIQLWHAVGAIKQFGLKDPSIAQRSQRALRRFKKVYERFDYVVVGSDKMADIFEQSFHTNRSSILRTGVPRTDFFFDEEATRQAEQQLRRQFELDHAKKVMLYAPTYRENELSHAKLVLDIHTLYKTCKDEYVLFLRLHPAVKAKVTNEYPDFVWDVSHYPSLNELLLVTDLLITDYSSIPFEFALLYKPMIFFAYDLEAYMEERGFWEPYSELVPGPVVRTTEELIEVVKSHRFSIDKVVEFANDWNEYSTGDASERLIRFLYVEREQQE